MERHLANDCHGKSREGTLKKSEGVALLKLAPGIDTRQLVRFKFLILSHYRRLKVF